MAAPKGWENLTIESKDGMVRMSGTIEDPDFVKRLRLVAARKKISYEKALHLMLEKGAEVIRQGTPVDGGTQRGNS